jgi:hypothetical protein
MGNLQDVMSVMQDDDVRPEKIIIQGISMSIRLGLLFIIEGKLRVIGIDYDQSKFLSMMEHDFWKDWHLNKSRCLLMKSERPR